MPGATRVGWGFDAHPLDGDPPLIIGGVEVSDRVGVSATSDGDVLAHAVAVAETYTVLRQAERARRLELVGFAIEAGAWREYAGPHGHREVLKPDAYAEWATREWEHAAFIEVDRSTENPKRIAAKNNRYLAYWRSGIEQARQRLFPSVLWLVPDERRADLHQGLLELAASIICLRRLRRSF